MQITITVVSVALMFLLFFQLTAARDAEDSAVIKCVIATAVAEHYRQPHSEEAWMLFEKGCR